MLDSAMEVSGRRLAFTEIGDPAGRPVFFFHGAPTSRLRLVDFSDDFAAAGARVISPDRPGYGGSDPLPGRTMLDWPRDVAAVADRLGIERFAVAGHSSGGPYAVACASVLGGRVTGGVVVAGVTDMGWPGAEKGYPEQEAELMRQPTEEAAVAWCVDRYGKDGMGFFESGALTFPKPDLEMLEAEPPGTWRAKASIEAWKQGVVGYAVDIHVQGQPWPFDPGHVSVPVVVVHGELDTLLPIAHSRHTAEIIPGAEFRILAGHGHFTILRELPGLVREVSMR